MGSDRKDKQSNSIPIRFFDGDEERSESGAEPWSIELEEAMTDEVQISEADNAAKPKVDDSRLGGPELAELIASRAELKRLEAALAEAQEAVARRQADFDNYRKRIERERGEAYNRVVAEVTRKLLPVLDNLNRALDAERSVETSESREFRHFLRGVELIGKQLNEVLESFGLQPIPAVGERFRSEEHTSELQSQSNLVCRLLLEKKKN